MKDAIVFLFMFEYVAVFFLLYDIDFFVVKLNECAAVGWDVVFVVLIGGEVSVIFCWEMFGAVLVVAVGVELVVVEILVVEILVVEVLVLVIEMLVFVVEFV